MFYSSIRIPGRIMHITNISCTGVEDNVLCSTKGELGGLVAVVASWLSGYGHPGFESRS